MPEVALEDIPEQWRMTVMEYARLANVTRQEAYRRMKDGDEREITWARGGRGRVIDAIGSKGLSTEAITEWQRRRPACADQEIPRTGVNTAPSGPIELIRQTESECALSDLKARIYRLNPTLYEGIEKRFLLIEPLTNHKWNLTASTKTEYVRHAARQAGPHGVAEATFWRWVKDFKDALANGGMEAALEALGDNKPGPQPGDGSPLDDSMKAIVTRLWLSGKTRKQCYEGMMAELGEKGRVLGAAWVYNAPSNRSITQ